jgi:hypothetical protein
LVHREIAAGATKEFVFGVKVNELEAIAESIPLANHGTNRHRAAWKHESQLDHLAQQSLNCQHSSHPGFANVHATAYQHAARSGVDSDGNLKFEPGAPAGVRDYPMGPRRGRILVSHIPHFRFDDTVRLGRNLIQLRESKENFALLAGHPPPVGFKHRYPLFDQRMAIDNLAATGTQPSAW